MHTTTEAFAHGKLCDVMFDWHKHRSALWNGMKVCRIDAKLLRVRMNRNVTYDICRVEWITFVFHYLDIITSCCLANLPGAGDVWFSLRGRRYQNNSWVALEDIGDRNDSLHCITNFTACCGRHYTGLNEKVLGNWFFPNGSRVPGHDSQWDFYRDRKKMRVHLHRRRGGVEGIYYCVIPDSLNVMQTIYIAVYAASTGEWCCMYICSWSVPLRLAVPICCRRV